MSLATLVKEIQKVKVQAEVNLELHTNPDTLRGVRGRKDRATETLRELKRSYKEQLLASTNFILVSGSAREEFVAEAKKLEQVFVTEADGLYKEMVKKIPTALYKTNVTNLFDVFSRYLEDKGGELDLNTRLLVNFKAKYQRSVKTAEEFTKIVREAINEQVGGAVIAINAVTSLVDSAIERGNGQKVTPVILETPDETLNLELRNMLKKEGFRVTTVSAGKTHKDFAKFTDLVKVKDVNAGTVGSVFGVKVKTEQVEQTEQAN